MWLFDCCAKSPVIDWSFPNGTLVSANSYEDALDTLHDYKLHRNNTQAYQTEQGRWTVQFDNDIYMSVEARNQAEAIQSASWHFYMDKRESPRSRAHSQA